MRLFGLSIAVIIFLTCFASAQTSTYVRPDAEKRFKNFVDDTIGPFAWLGVAAGAGIATARNSPKEWDRNAKGFSRRVASNFGRNVIRNSVTYGLDEALSLDSRFYRSKKRGVGVRVANALISPVTARKPNGNRTIGIPRIAGTYTANVVAAEAWFPPGYSWKDGMKSGTISLGVRALFNLASEFVFKK